MSPVKHTQRAFTELRRTEEVRGWLGNGMSPVTGRTTAAKETKMEPVKCVGSRGSGGVAGVGRWRPEGGKNQGDGTGVGEEGG